MKQSINNIAETDDVTRIVVSFNGNIVKYIDDKHHELRKCNIKSWNRWIKKHKASEHNELCEDDIVGMSNKCMFILALNKFKLCNCPIVMLKDGCWAIKTKLKCTEEKCNKEHVFYLRSGGAGFWQYACNINGKILADLRNKSWICTLHRI
jgi:hypothetical protein